jgi:copper-containing nitrite reductase
MKLIKIGIFFLFLAIVLAACGSQMTQIISKEYVLTTELKDGNLFFLGVSDEINGQPNPTLSAEPGETITVTLINGGQGQHDITFPLIKASTGLVTEKGEEVSVTFKVPNQDGELSYYDSVGNHAELGMRGVLKVGAGQTADQPVSGSMQNSTEVVTAFQKGTCGSCHTIAGIPNAKGMVGPDLTNVKLDAEKYLTSGGYHGSAKSVEDYVRESILKPDVFVSPSCPMGACPMGVMPPTMSQTLSQDEINAIVGYLSSLPEGAYSDQSTAQAESVAPVEAPAPAIGEDIARDPTDIPASIGIRAATTVRLDLEAMEVVGQLADGTTFPYWTFNGKVPGPFFRVRVGDTVEVHLKNNPSSTMNHSVDFHAVTGPGGGAVFTSSAPGVETMFTFKALNPGLYVYHCATPMVAEHISNGMYGMILVEPEGGLPKVDREFYVMQGEIYTTGKFGEQGMQMPDTDKLLNETPDYYVLNGEVGALTANHPLKAEVGETVRIFFGVGGPNKTSAFHVIGEIFDRVYNLASVTTPPMTDVQTTLVPPGGATMVEFQVQVPGRYILVDHALSRLQRGLAGYLVVEGPEAPEILNGTPMPGSGH